MTALGAPAWAGYAPGMLKFIRYACLVLIVAIGGVWAHAWFTRAPGQNVGEAFAQRLASIFGQSMPVPSVGGGVQLPSGVSLGGPFSLTRQDGQAVTERDYAGKWLLLYFGYTYCPDVCPTELGRIADVLDAMGPAGEQVTPMMITIDPDRDTQAVMADYVSRFHPRMQGLTGTGEQVAEAARRFRVFYQKVQPRDMNEYLMDHSSFIYLVGPDGRVRTLYRPETSVEDMARSVAAQMRSSVVR